MHFNNYILIVLYLPVIYFYLSYLGLGTVRTNLTAARKKLNKLLALVFIGIILAILVGYNDGKFPSDLSRIDISRITHFLLIFIIPLVLIDNRLIKKAVSKKILLISLFAFTFSIGYSLFTAGIGKSSFAGNIFGATTINLTLISIVAFYGLFQYYLYRTRSGLILSVVAWIICLASLAKWNFWVDIMIPLLLIRIFLFSKRSITKKIIIVPLLAIVFIALIIPNFEDYMDSFAANLEYNSFENYLNSRVLRTGSSNVMYESGAVLNIGDKGISDGARISMWYDLLQRTWERPIFGLGLGTRAFDYRGVTIEDHSVLIFIISRFGILLGILILTYIIKLVKLFYVFSTNENYPFLKYIYLALIGNFFFQSLVGMVWGQLPVTLFLGIILSFIFTEMNQNHQIYAK
jgi:hypothetical protein